jgi:P pilus assembly chaperone PapD
VRCTLATITRAMILAGLVVWLLPNVAAAQAILIAPNAIVIDARTGTAAVTLVNTGDRTAEVSLTTLYGFPTTDSAGRMRLQTFDVVSDTAPSAATWLRAFPERLMVAPGTRRTIRLLVTPPPGLPPREYWARLVVASRAAPAMTDTAHAPPDEPSAVQIGLTLEVRSVLGVFYRNSPVTTGVTLDSVRTTLDGDSIVARVRMTRRGNAAFVGSLRATVRDSTDAVRATAVVPLGVYYTLDPRLPIPRSALPGGRYTLVLEAVSSRPDVAAGALLPIAPTRIATTLILPPLLASTGNRR